MQKITTHKRMLFIGAPAATMMSGCGRAPSFNILGSYFPGWLLCILIGISGASIVSTVLGKLEKSYLIRWTIFVYPCLASAIACTLWLIFFS